MSASIQATYFQSCGSRAMPRLSRFSLVQTSERRAHRHVIDARIAGQLERTVAVGALDGGEMHAGLEHVSLEFPIEPDAALPADRIGDGGDDVQQIGAHGGPFGVGR